MDPTEAEKFLGDVSGFTESAAKQVESLPPVGTTPRAPSFLGRIGPKEAERQFVQANVQEGVPLDVESGLGTWERLMVDLRRNRDNQIAYLEKHYGPGSVRFSTDGELIVKMPDPENQGKSKDVLVNPHKMKAVDFLDLITTAPEVAASIYAMRKGQKIPGIGKVKGLAGIGRDALAAAVGGEAAGAIKDVAANVVDFGAPEFGKTLEERAGSVPAMAAIGAAGGTIPKLWQFAKNPLASQRGALQYDALAAQKYFKDRYGIDVPMSIGQSTGAPLFGRSEVFIEKMPGGSGPVRKLASSQEGALRRLQEIMLGTSQPSEEEIGTRALAELQPKLKAVTGATETARQELAKEAQDAIEQGISNLTSPTRELYQSQTGSAIRKAVVAKRDAEKAEADRLYAAVRAAPGGTGKVFEGQDLQQRFEQILKNLPSAETSKTVPTGILSPTGIPITTTVRSNELLEKWPPDKLLARLREITSMKDPKFALSDLQQMRRDIHDDILRGEGVPGLGTHYLSQISDAITTFLEDSIKKLPTSDLKTALKAANDHYKNKVVPFNRVGLNELFRTPEDSGFVSDSEIVQRIIGGGKAIQNWNLLKETLGTGSPEFTRLRRSVADNILSGSRIPGESTIDAQTFVKNLYQLRQKYPEIADDVFTKKENELFRQARFLKYAQGDKLDERELSKLIAGGTPTASKLQALVAAERNRDKVFQNQIFKSIGDGSFNQSQLNPSDFLNRLVDSSSVGISQVREVMSHITDPALVEDIRRKTYEKIFRDAARAATANDVNLIMSGKATRILSGTSIAKALGQKDYREKIKSILGADGYKDLDQYVKLQAATELPEQSFRSAGGLAAGTQIAQAERILERGGILAYGGNVARSFLFSYLLSNPASRAWLTRVPNDRWAATAFLHTLVSSPQFLEAVSKEFPKAPGMQFIHNLKSVLDRNVSELNKGQGPATPPTKLRSPEEWNKFLGGSPNAMNLNPAVRTMDGEVAEGKPGQTHNDIIKMFELAPEDIDRREFTDGRGNELSREEAAKLTRLPTNVEFGRLHSTDLPS